MNKFVDFIFLLDTPEIFISKEFEDYIISSKKINPLEAQEIVEQNVNQIHNEIKFRISSHNHEFTKSKYIYSSYDNDKLVKYSLTVSKDERIDVELRIKWREKIKEILKQIEWREFEFLAQYILESNYITKNIQITKSGNDQGIDFWGYFEENDLRINRFKKDLKFRIVGQVKHSTSDVKVTHSKISSFGTELNRLRMKDPENYFLGLSKEFFNSPLPIVGLFLTNTDYIPKARNFSKDYGIIIWNGNQISEDLANSKFISKIIESDTKLSFLKLKEMLKK